MSAGSKRSSAQSGARSRLVECLVDARCEVAQGLAWDRPSNRLFWADAPVGQLFAVSLASGVVQSWPLPCPVRSIAMADGGRILVGLVDGAYLFNPQTYDLHFLADGPRMPNGATDVEGADWRCDTAPGSVSRYAPDGRLLARIDLPVLEPTSCCLGGPNMKLLFIGSRRNASPSSGGIFMVPVDIPGAGIRPLNM